MEELHSGKFHNVVAEIDSLSEDKVTRVIFSSGKVYFDLLEQRREQNIENIAICRVEQLYPFPRDEVIEQVSRYKNATEIVWCQ